MRKSISLGLILLSLFVAIGFAGCIGSDPIVGSWTAKTVNSQLIFNADKTVVIISGGLTLPGGTWVNEGDGEYRIISEIVPGKTYTVQMSKNGRTLTSGSGYSQETYVKV